jgi:hypothetical protein
VVCERRGGASTGALHFFGLFSCSSRRFDAKRGGGGDSDREREEVGWRKSVSCRVLSFSFTVVSLQWHAFRQVGSIDEDRSFSRRSGGGKAKLNFSRCVDIFSVFFPPVGCERKCSRVWCCLQAFFVAGSRVKLWRTNILACFCCCALERLRIFLIRPCALRACRVICFVFVG